MRKPDDKVIELYLWTVLEDEVEALYTNMC